MTWNILQSASVSATGNAASQGVTYGSNVSSGTKLICYLGISKTTALTISSVQDTSGNSLTQVGYLLSTGNGVGAAIFAMDTPPGDVGTRPAITVTFSATCGCSMLIQEVSGLAAGSTLAVMIDGTAASAAFAAGSSHAQPAYSSTAAGEFLVALCADNGGPQTVTAPAGYTMDPNAVTGNNYADVAPAYKNSAGGAETGTWTFGGTTTGTAIMAVAFQLAGGGGGPGADPIVTATNSGTGAYNGITLTVKVLTGASGVTGATASSISGSVPQIAVTPAASGSILYGAVGNGNGATTFTANGATTFTANVVDSAYTTTMGTFRGTAKTTAGTPVTVGASAPSDPGNIAISVAEIEAYGTLAEDASSPAAVSTTTATAISTASFTPPAGSLLVAMVSCNITDGSGQSSTITVSDTNGLTWIQHAPTGWTVGGGTQQVTAVFTAAVPGAATTVPGAAALSGAGTLNSGFMSTAPPGVSYRAIPAVTSTTTTPGSWPVAKQAGTVAGDWVFIWVYGGGSTAACTGFTTLADASNYSALLYRYCDGSEGATFTITGLTGARPLTVLIATIAGAAATLDPASPAAPVSGSSGTSIPASSITMGGGGDLVLWFGGDESAWAGPGYAITPPAGFTTRATNGPVPVNATVLLADTQSLPAGPTGIRTGTFAVTGGAGGGALNITTTTLPAAAAGTAYSTTLAASGGTGTGFTWSVAGGSFPSWATLNTATGVISGASPVAGTSNFTVGVTDSAGNSDTQALTLLANPAVSSAVPVGPGGTWTLAFEDQFTGTAINSANWAVLQGASINSVTTSAANVSVSGGYARLVLSSASTGAAICTYNHLAGTGIAGTGPSVSGPTMNVGDCCEASISFPGPGSPTGEFYNFPAWWASGANWPANGEIDIIECYTGTPVSSYHGNGVNDGIPAPSGNYANGFHTYTMVRGTSSFQIYWDGKLVWNRASADDGGPMNMIINVGIKAGEPEITGASSTVLVDYVRLWTPA